MKRRTLAAVIGLLVGLLWSGLSAVALTPGQQVVLFNGCPGSVQVAGQCGTAGLNFQTQTYWTAATGTQGFSSFISLTRASNEVCAYSNGTLISVGSNVPCITDQGWQIMEARTNKCTNYNANPPALVTPTTAAAFNAAVTNMTAGGGDVNTTWGVINASSNLTLYANVTNGRAYQIDNRLGAANAFIVIAGPTGNTNAHTLSVVWYGSGTGNLRLEATGTNVSIPATATRYTVTITPTLTTRQFVVEALPGALIDFTLNQLEEGSFATPPIVVAGASATRAADVPTLIGRAATAALAAKSAFFQTNGYAGGTQPYLINITNGNSPRVAISTGGATGLIVSGANLVIATPGSGTYAGATKTAAGFDAASMTMIINGGAKASTANAWDATSNTVTLGNAASGVRALNGFMQQLNLGAVKGQFDNSTSP